ncbi:MAG: replication factor C small subunit [Promethearchaeota archaeon]
MSEPWVEKYRPRRLDDVVNQTEIVRRLKTFVAEKSMPHLIFAGPAGTGKTTCALCLVNDLFGAKRRRNVTYLELNASDARGIDVIRTTVKDFAKTMPPHGIPFKVLVLDEADNMTGPAQQALRRTMENFTSNCRMILICNYSNKIIPPIQSRCALFRFRPLKNRDIVGRIGAIARRENLKLTKGGMKAVLYVAGGDCRRAINVLQAAGMVSGTVDEDTVFRITGRVQPVEIRALIEQTLNGELAEAKDKLDQLVREYGLSGRNITKQVHRELLVMDIPERQKLELLRILGKIDFRLSQGATEEIQLNALLAKFYLLGHE